MPINNTKHLMNLKLKSQLLRPVMNRFESYNYQQHLWQRIWYQSRNSKHNLLVFTSRNIQVRLQTFARHWLTIFHLIFQMHWKVQKTHEALLIKGAINLTAADGSNLEIQGKTIIEFQCQCQTYQQHFIVVRILGIVGILGIDFLTTYDGSIKIKNNIFWRPQKVNSNCMSKMLTHAHKYYRKIKKFLSQTQKDSFMPKQTIHP